MSTDQARQEMRVPPSGRCWPGLAGLWLFACLWLLTQRLPAIRALRLPDSDDDLRLLQVRGWLAGQGWFDLRQYRLDPPIGADIHWSRLVDLPLAAMIRLLAPLLGGPVAERVAVTAVPLLTLLAAMALLGWIARRTIAPGAWWWPPLLLLMASPVVDMMAPLRIDHHGWQIVAVLALLAGLIAPARRGGGAAAGLAIAASLAIGLEMLPFLALGAALAAGGWITDRAEGERLRWLCVGAGGGTLLALLVFIPPAQRMGFACDALSATYALPLFGGCAVLAMGSMGGLTVRARLGWTALAASVAVAALLPGGGALCLVDPYHAVDPTARRLWLDTVSEALPLWRQTPEVFWASLALPLFGLAGAGLMLARAAPGERRRWLAIFAFALVATGLALAATRSAVAAQALALPGAGALGWLGRRRLAASGTMLVRVFGSVLLFLTVSAILPRLAIAALAHVPETKAEAVADSDVEACMRPATLATLDRLPAGTVLSLIDMTPALLLHSHHAGIAGPYHRNGRAIADVMRAWAGTPAEAEAIARRHRVTYVMLCGDPAEGRLYDRRGPDGLHARLMRGAAPAWLAPVAIQRSPWRVWRVAILPGAPAAS